MFYNNKVVWITGASSGIGEAICYELVKQNAKVIISSNQKNDLQKVKEECIKLNKDCYIQYLDLLNTGDIDEITKNIIEKFGRIDILINNAGISQRALTKDTPISIDRKIFEINYFGTIALTKAVLPYMLKQKSGYIAATSSISGKFGFPLRSAYAASKHAICGFFETLRAEVYNDNIKVLIAFPGRVKTDISKHALTKDGTSHNKMDDGQNFGISAEKCAKKYIRAIQKDKKEVLIGGKELIMVYIKKYLPKLFYKLARKIKPE